MHRGKEDIQKLERVHRKAAQFCASNYNHYAGVREMLQDLNWETLATRGKTARLSFMYKFSHNLREFLVEAHLKPTDNKRICGSHASKFVVPKAKTDIFKISFFP